MARERYDKGLLEKAIQDGNSKQAKRYRLELNTDKSDQTFDCSGWSFDGKKKMRALGEAIKNSHVKHLILKNIRISKPEVMEELKSVLKGCPSIETLDLSDNPEIGNLTKKMTKSGPRLLIALAKVLQAQSSVRTLILKNTGLNNERALAELGEAIKNGKSKVSSVTTLDISDNAINSGLVTVFAGWLRLTNLKTLMLKGNNSIASSQAILALADSVPSSMTDIELNMEYLKILPDYQEKFKSLKDAIDNNREIFGLPPLEDKFAALSSRQVTPVSSRRASVAGPSSRASETSSAEDSDSDRDSDAPEVESREVRFQQTSGLIRRLGREVERSGADAQDKEKAQKLLEEGEFFLGLGEAMVNTPFEEFAGRCKQGRDDVQKILEEELKRLYEEQIRQKNEIIRLRREQNERGGNFARQADLERLEASVADIQVQIAPVMEEFERRQIVARQQDYLLANNNVAKFYLELRRNVYSSLLGFVTNGKLKQNDTMVSSGIGAAGTIAMTSAKIAKGLLDKSSDLATAVPIVGAAVKGGAMVTKFAYDKYVSHQREKAAEIISNSAAVLDGLESIAEHFSRLIAFRHYGLLSNRLKSKNTDYSNLGEAAAHIAHKAEAALYDGLIKSEFKTGGDFVGQLASVLSTFKIRDGKIFFGMIPTFRKSKGKLVGSGRRTFEAMQSRSGLMWPDYDGQSIFYATPKGAKPDEFGYRWAYFHEKQGLAAGGSWSLASSQFDETELAAAAEIGSIEYIDPSVFKRAQRHRPENERGARGIRSQRAAARQQASLPAGTGLSNVLHAEIERLKGQLEGLKEQVSSLESSRRQLSFAGAEVHRQRASRRQMLDAAGTDALTLRVVDDQAADIRAGADGAASTAASTNVEGYTSASGNTRAERLRGRRYSGNQL